MDRLYPAVEIRWSTPPDTDRVERLLAALDDEAPTAVQERESGVAVFFPSAENRDRAEELARVFAPDAIVTSTSVSDEAWAERSQASLTPVRVGRIVVTPPWAHVTPSGDDIVITIVPSMGFGTGHHASTRLCLGLLQPWPSATRSVLDVGTGSGVLALAARHLGATQIVGIDVDADALTSARENVDLNDASANVQLRAVDLGQAADEFGQGFDLVLANLTGGMLERFTSQLRALVAANGRLIVSGFQNDEEDQLVERFGAVGLTAEARAEEDRWVGLRLAASS